MRIWLNGLGLSRYAPVFEVHEVDDEVLPMLTLEDLKDMGINAVGSRRKMYCAIRSLGRGFHELIEWSLMLVFVCVSACVRVPGVCVEECRENFSAVAM